MQEYVTEAVVLDTVPSAELDVRVSLFTKKFGKLVARAKSVKKITSKLAGHLEPGNIIKIRLVEKKGLQLVDALKEREVQSLSNSRELESDEGGHTMSPPDLYLLNQILHEAERDPAAADCVRAGCTGTPAAFHIKTQEFYCSACASKVRRNEVILL